MFTQGIAAEIFIVSNGPSSKFSSPYTMILKWLQKRKSIKVLLIWAAVNPGFLTNRLVGQVLCSDRPRVFLLWP